MNEIKKNKFVHKLSIELEQPSHSNHSLAAQLNSEVRVLCWIMTNPGNHEERAKPIRDTWGKRCNILLFMTTEDGSLI